MTLTGLDAGRCRYLNLAVTQRITLVEVAKFEQGPMPPHWRALYEAVEEWRDLSTGTFSEHVSHLVEDGLLEAHKDGHTKRYTLTDDGRQVLAAGRDQLNDVLGNLPDE